MNTIQLKSKSDSQKNSIYQLILIGLSIAGLTSCLKSPFQNSQGNFSYRGVNQNLGPQPAATVSQTSGSAGTVALSIGTQMIARLETDLKAGGLSPDQASVVAAQARGEMQVEAGKVVISTLRETALWLELNTGLSLLQETTDLMGKMSGAVARGAVKSLASDSLKDLPASFKQNAVGLMASSVMGSMTVSPQKLSDNGIGSVAGTLMEALITSLPDAGFSGDMLLSGMSKVMEKAVGALDEAGLSAGSTGATVTSMTQTTLTKATEMTKGSSIAGSAIGFIASAAISGLSSTGVSAADSMSAVETVTKASVKSAVGLDSSVDLAKSIETLTNMTTKAMASVTLGTNVVAGLERLVTAATQAVAEATTKTSGDLFAKMTAGIVSGSVSAVDSVAEKSGKGAASLVQTMVNTTASTAAQAAPASMVVNMLSQVTTSAIKALNNSSLASNNSFKTEAVSGVIQGSVSALSKVSSQDSSMSSAGIQGISKAGTAAAATVTSNAADLSALTNQIMTTGIATMNTTMAGGDTTKLVSLASDMARGAASGMASSSGEDMSRRVNELAATAVTAMNTITTGTGTASSVLTSFASSMAGAISAGLAVGGQSSADITALNASLSTSIINSVVVFSPGIDTTALKTQVDSQAKAGADLAGTLAQGGVQNCNDVFNDNLNDGDFTTRLNGKLTGVFCKIDVAVTPCPKPRRLDQGDYFWAWTPPDLCELRAVPLASNTATTMSAATGVSTATGTTPLPPLPGMPPIPPPMDPGMYGTGTMVGTGIGTGFGTGTGTGIMAGFDLGPTDAHPKDAGEAFPDNVKGFYSEAHHTHWIMVPMSGGVSFKWSVDNQTWTEGATLPIAGHKEVALDYYTSPLGTQIVLAVVVSGKIDIYQGTVNSASIDITGPVGTLSGPYSKPTVAVTPSMVWVGGVRETGSTYQAEVKYATFPANPTLSFAAHIPVGPVQKQIHSVELLGHPNGDASLVINGDELTVHKNVAGAWSEQNDSNPEKFAVETFPMKSTSWLVNAIKYHSGKLYVGGQFETMGGVPGTRNFAVYDFGNNSWSAFGNGFNNPVYAIEVDASGDLYVGGEFSHAGNKRVDGIAKWANGQWNALGQGLGNGGYSGAVYAIKSYPTIGIFPAGLYIGGAFDETRGPSPVELNSVAFWDGSTFSPLAQTGADPGVGFMGMVFALEKEGNDLYVGGVDFDLSQVPYHGALAKYNLSTNTWSGVSDGATVLEEGTVNALKHESGQLYVGGDFIDANFNPLFANGDYLVRFDLGSPNWVAMGSPGILGIDPPSVTALEVFNGYLFVGGSFTSAYSYPASNLAKYNIASPGWSGFADGADGQVFGFSVDGSSNLYIGGLMSTVNSQFSPGLGKYAGGSLTPFDTNPPLNGKIYDAVAMPNGDIYVAGDFTRIGGASASRFARWNFSSKTWEAVGLNDIDGPVNSLARKAGSDEIYLGGGFGNVNGTAANGVARYNTSTPAWNNYTTEIGNGNSAVIYDMEFYQNQYLFIAGSIPGSGSNMTKCDTSTTCPTWSAITPPADYTGTPNQIAITGDGKVIVARTSYPQHQGIPVYDELASPPWSAIATNVDVDTIYSLWAGADVFNIIVGGSFAEIVPNNPSQRSGLGYTFDDSGTASWKSLSPTTPTLPEYSKPNSIVKATIAGTNYLLVGGEIRGSNPEDVKGFGIFNLTTQKWDTTLSVDGEIKKIIPGPAGSPYENKFILVGMFNSIGGLPSSGIAVVKPSSIGLGSDRGVAATIDGAYGEINLLVTRETDVSHEVYDPMGSSWNHTEGLGPASINGPVSHPNIMVHNQDVRLMWVQDGNVLFRAKLGGNWESLDQEDLGGTFVERLFLDRSMHDGIVKMIFGDINSYKVMRAN